MSLLDTIKGAREEAKEAGGLLSSNKDGADAKAAGSEPAEALKKASGQYGRVADAVKLIDPRKE